MKPKRDCTNEFGCCLTCDESKKEQVEGLQQDIYYKGKHYNCFCESCLCPQCSWLFNRECQRKSYDELNYPTPAEAIAIHRVTNI